MENPEVTQDKSTAVDGKPATIVARMITIRSGLGLEIRSGLKVSRRFNMVDLANKVTGNTKKGKRAAYEALNAYIVNLGGQDKPL